MQRAARMRAAPWPWPELHAIFFLAIWAGSSCEEISTQFGLIWSQFGSQRNCENFLTSISAGPVAGRARAAGGRAGPSALLVSVALFADGEVRDFRGERGAERTGAAQAARWPSRVACPVNSRSLQVPSRRARSSILAPCLSRCSHSPLPPPPTSPRLSLPSARTAAGS